MTRGQPDPVVIRRHISALRDALHNLQRHSSCTAAELKVLPQEFATRIRTIAGFRNVLVHGYLQVDLNVVEKVLSQRLGDLAEFADRVERSLEDDEA